MNKLRTPVGQYESLDYHPGSVRSRGRGLGKGVGKGMERKEGNCAAQTGTRKKAHSCSLSVHCVYAMYMHVQCHVHMLANIS